MKKSVILARLLSVLAMIVLLAGSTVISYFIIRDPNADIDDSVVLEKIEEDTGVLANHIFQAECAEHSGFSTNMDHACVGKSYYYNPTFGGGIAVRNLSNNVFTFRFTSDKTYKVPLVVRLSSDKSWAATALSNAYDIKMNNKTVKTDGVVVPGSDVSAQIDGSKYFNMVDAEVVITIREGDNELQLQAQGSALNLDYVNVRTSATIVNKTDEQFWAQDFVSVVEAPTMTSAGKLSFVCPEEGCGQTVNFTSLPAFTNSTYERETENGIVSFYLTVAGQRVFVGSEQEEIVNARYTLTLNNGKFADNSTSKIFMAGEAVNPVNTLSVPENRVFAGWYNVEDENELYGTDGFEMPAKDITIAPYFDGVYVDTTVAESGVGKLRLGVSPNNSAYFQSSSTTKPSQVSRLFNGERGDVLTSASIEAGQYCIPMTGYQITAVKHTFAYTFTNFSDNALTLQVYQVNASASASTVPASAQTITLAKGETKTVEVNVSGYANKNILPVFAFPNGATNLNLGVVGYCTYVEQAQEETPTYTTTKSYAVNGDKDFFKATDWEGFDGVARTDKLYNQQGELQFTSATASRFNLFYQGKTAGDVWVHLGDKSASIDEAAAAMMYGKSFTYTMGIKTTGAFELLLLGASKTTAPRSNTQNGIYLAVGADRTITVYQGCTGAAYRSWGEFSASSSIKTDGTENTVAITLTRIDGDTLTIGLTVNGVAVQFGGTSAKPAVFSATASGEFRSDGVFTTQGYGQRIGFIPLDDTVVSVSSLAITVA